MASALVEEGGQSSKTEAQDNESAPVFRTAKVTPAGTAPSKRPLKKKLAFLNVKLKQLIVEEDEDIAELESRSSLGAKIFILFVGITALALGSGLTYHAGQTNLTDFYVIGIGCILIGIGSLLGFSLVVAKDIYYHRLLKKRKQRIVRQENIITQELNDQTPRYFIPPSDVSKQAIERRKPSDIDLYGILKKANMRDRVKSAGLQSDGVLTTTGLSIRERSSDSRGSDFSGLDTERSLDRWQMSPPPQVAFPQNAQVSEMEDFGLEEEANPVFTAEMTVGEAPKKERVDSVEDVRVDTATIKREITDLYQDPSEEEKTLAKEKRENSFHHKSSTTGDKDGGT